MTFSPQSRTTRPLKHALITGCALSPLVMALQQVHAAADIARHYVPVATLDDVSREVYAAQRPYCSGVWVQPTQKRQKPQKRQLQKPADTPVIKASTKPYQPSEQPADTDAIKQQRHFSDAQPAKPSDSLSIREAGKEAEQDQTIIATADSAYFSPERVGKLYGDVQVSQGDKTIHANQVDIDLATHVATAQGDVAIQDGDIYSETQAVSYDISSSSAQIEQSAFFSEKRQAHGTAERIEQREAGVVRLHDVTYSTCPPSVDKEKKQNKPWEITASKLKLDDNTGRGYAKHARLTLLGVPTLYLPYINFPIDDRRMSGFLIPKLGYSNDGGVDFSAPYYFNLASHYDLTLTPRILFGRGAMIEGEFRYLFDGQGQAKIEGGYVPKDDDYYDTDRKYLKATHDWQISRRFNSRAEYNYVSDKDYFNDLGSDPLIQDELNLPRRLTLNYTDDKRELEGKIKVETFQTVDPALPDSQKPYARLPQLTLAYKKGNPLGLMSQLDLDLGYFSKRIDDGSAVENSGARYYGKAGVGYHVSRPWGSLKPALSIEQLLTVFDDVSVQQQGLVRGKNDRESITVPSFTLDANLILENKTLFANQPVTQVIEPRIFYSYAPFKNQTRLPNFDTTTASLSYDQLFTNQRFIGHDRLTDSNALSVGINYRVYDHTGLERLNIGLGNRVNFNDKQIQVTGNQTNIRDTSGPIARIQGYLTPELSLTSDVAFQDNGHHNFHISQLNWQPTYKSYNMMLNLGYFDRAANTVDNQKRLRQATASLVMPLTKQLNLLAHTQYDFGIDKQRDLLVGANYESCCYRLSLYGRRFYNNLDDPTKTKPNNRVMLELSFKGLAGISGGLDKLLGTKVMGYNVFNSD